MQGNRLHLCILLAEKVAAQKSACDTAADSPNMWDAIH